MTGEFAVPIFKTIKETAKLTGLATYRVRQIVKSEKIKYLKAGNKFLINIQNFLEYLENGDIETNVGEYQAIRKVDERIK